MEYYVFIIYIMSSGVVNRDALMSPLEKRKRVNAKNLAQAAADVANNKRANVEYLAQEAADVAHRMSQRRDAPASSSRESELRGEVAVDDNAGADDDNYDYSGDPNIKNIEMDIKTNIEINIVKMYDRSLWISSVGTKLLKDIESLKDNLRNLFDHRFKKGGTRKRSSILSRKRSGKYKFYKKKRSMKQKSKRRRSSRR